MSNNPMDRLVADASLCVADLGARGGLDEDMLAIAWACEVIGFEPDPEEAKRLAGVGDPRWRKVTVLPYAIGGSNGQAILHVPESSEGASLLKHNSAMLDMFGYDNLHVDKAEIPVIVHTLDELRGSAVLPRIDYLKIDIEGAELDVLKGGESVLQDCVALKVECSFLPQRLNQPLIWEVAHYLVSRNFCAMELRDVRHWRRRNLPAHPYRINFHMPYSRGQLAQCDLIFLRSPDALLDQAQLLRLVIASAVLGYYDHAVNVLRKSPAFAAWVVETYGADLESELARWSLLAGRQATRQAIAKSLRGLVPLFRSAMNRLPYVKPRRSY